MDHNHFFSFREKRPLMIIKQKIQVRKMTKKECWKVSKKTWVV